MQTLPIVALDATATATALPRTRESIRRWVDAEVAPFAGDWHRAEAISPEVVRRIREG